MNPTGIEAQVCADIAARQARGIAKYGTTVADNPLTLNEWLQHAYEEALDMAIYLKRAMAPRADYRSPGIREAAEPERASECGLTECRGKPMCPRCERWKARDDGMPGDPDERRLRRLLAVRVAMQGTYYDDGEAQGQEHGINIDFMRDPVAVIDSKLRELNLARGKALATAEPDHELVNDQLCGLLQHGHAAGEDHEDINAFLRGTGLPVATVILMHEALATFHLRKGLTFERFRRANVTRCLKWHPEGIESWSPSDWMTAIVGELGELASLIKMRNRERDGLPGNKFSPTDDQIASEAADVMTYLDLFCAAHKIDLGRAVVAKFNEVSERVGFPDRIEVQS